jgi:hypothetical protein
MLHPFFRAVMPTEAGIEILKEKKENSSLPDKLLKCW